MSTADRVAMVVFLGLLLLGLCMIALQRLLRHRPKQRAAARLAKLASRSAKRGIGNAGSPWAGSVASARHLCGIRQAGNDRGCASILRPV